MSAISGRRARAIGRLHVLTDYHFQQRFAHAEMARLAIEGGAEVVQFRQKHGGVRHQLYEAVRASAVCRERGVPLLINDRLDVMLAAQAAGVHLGQEDLPVSAARRILGPEVIVGATATTAEQARRAADEGADYVGFGPVYTTGSKANPAAVKGLRGLAEVCRAVAIPVVGIAGITPERVRPVLEAGAHGVAVMTAITTARDPRAATARFRRAIDAVVDGA